MTIKQIVNYLMSYMKNHNYSSYQKCFYKIINNLAFCIEFDFSAGLVYATYYIIPLFIPCQNRYYTYGCRFNALKNQPLEILHRNAGYEDFIRWCDNLIDCLENVVFPLFRQIDTPQKLCRFIDINKKATSNCFSCTPLEIIRLQFYLYSYLGDLDQAVKTAEEYQYSLKMCTYLIPNVKSGRSQEVDNLCRIIHQGLKCLNEHFKNTVEESIKACF